MSTTPSSLSDPLKGLSIIRAVSDMRSIDHRLTSIDYLSRQVDIVIDNCNVRISNELSLVGRSNVI